MRELSINELELVSGGDFESDELPSFLPELEQIEHDARMLSGWINEFSTRK